MAVLRLLRTIVFAISLLLSFIVLGLAADLTNLTTANAIESFYWAFQPLGIATASLNIITIPIMWFLDQRNPGLFTSMLVVELSWLFVMWVLWLSTGATAASVSATFVTADCSRYVGTLSTGCSEIQAVEAFSFLNWILFFGYSITVLVFAIKSASDGQSVWTVSVRTVTWSSEKVGVAAPVPVSYPQSVPLVVQNGHSPAPTQVQPPAWGISHPPSPGHPHQGSDNGNYNQGYPAQGYPNQGPPNQGYPNQGYSNQGSPNQGYPNQGQPNPYPNQGQPNPSYPNPSYPNPAYPNQGHPNQGYQGGYQEPVPQNVTGQNPPV